MEPYRISIIICYFGRWPDWFNVFIETCRFNPTVDFLVFTNCQPVPAAYNNINFIDFDLPTFNALASAKLGLAINITEPYKLCDFKPAYGLIFEDYLSKTHFWGYCDVDIVLGNIRKFVDQLLGEYDVISAKKEYLVGSFALYRNDQFINRLFEQSEDYQLVFMSPRHWCFDECNYLWWSLLAGAPIESLKWEIDSMSHVVMRLQKKGVIRAFFQTMVVEQDTLKEDGCPADWKDQLLWHNGSLVNLTNNQEYLYFHFHFLKQNKAFITPKWAYLHERFYITESGFHAEPFDGT